MARLCEGRVVIVRGHERRPRCLAADDAAVLVDAAVLIDTNHLNESESTCH